jgi:hypothetical protein
MEEAFAYLYPRVLAYPVSEPQHPQQYDNWPGEAPLTIMIPLTPTPTATATATPTPTPTPTPNCDPGVDTDSDSFDNDIECYLATDPDDACPDWVGTQLPIRLCPGPTCDGDDAWPLDLNVDRQVSVVADVLNFRGRIGATPGSPNWSQRLNFNGDGQLSVVGDVLMYRGMIGETCT